MREPWETVLPQMPVLGPALIGVSGGELTSDRGEIPTSGLVHRLGSGLVRRPAVCSGCKRMPMLSAGQSVCIQ